MSENISSSYENDSKVVASKYKSKLTLNSYGMMFNMLNPYFIQAMNLMDKSKPVADLGVAYGFTTKKLLDCGFQKVIANDLEEKHLKELWDSVPVNQKNHLELMPGNVLDIDFDKESLGGITALKLLHFIHGNDVRKLFSKFFDWLAPGGYLMIAVCSLEFHDFSKQWDNDGIVKKKYLERIKNKEEWPCSFTKEELFSNDNTMCRNFPDKMNLLTNDILVREANLAGFEVLKCEYFGCNFEEEFYIRDCTRREEASIICYKRF